ncbi:hypothetical protein RB595_009530 [Gaeumannomyces hyphopodioides]
MTSYVRTGADTYNGVVAPRYNILSYTWGRYQDRSKTPGPALPVRGVDWPIPPILESHFTVAAFERAIRRATSCLRDGNRGSRERCDWLWVDIACIPQEHKGESPEARDLRQQEIAKQVEIFKRAHTAFAWLGSLWKPAGRCRRRRRPPRRHRAWATRRFRRRSLHRRRCSLRRELPPVLFEEIRQLVYSHPRGPRSKWAAKELLRKLDMCSERFSTWQSSVLEHRWFKSLWTLQELVLRPDAYLLFEDGFLWYAGDSRGATTHLYSFSCMGRDMFALSCIFASPNKIVDRILSDATVISARGCRRRAGAPAMNAIDAGRAVVRRVRERLARLFALMQFKGLDSLYVKFPHNAYSGAQHRTASKLVDRIHGIVQIYGIECGARLVDPPGRHGGGETAELHSLEDEFGEKLVAKVPVLSQLFIHSRTGEQGPPRRSWLITQNCKVNDNFWWDFAPDQYVTNLFSTFETERQGVGGDLRLRFKGLAWQLDGFTRVLAQSSCLLSEVDRRALFQPCVPGSEFRYRGLMLDHHVSRTVLGRVVDYFHSYEEMTSAVRALYKHYCGGGDGSKGNDEIVPSPQHLGGIRVCLLGFSCALRLPIPAYVGIVLVPVSETAWQRIGLMRWVEMYTQATEKPHWFLPQADTVDCSII